MDAIEPQGEEELPLLSVPTPPGPSLRRLLVGDDGLRAGWSLLLFALLLGLLGGTSNFLIRHFHLLPHAAATATREMRVRSTVIGEALAFSAVAFVAFLMSRIERRPFSRYGLSRQYMLPDFFFGLAVGLIALSGLAGALVLAHALTFDGVLLHGRVAVISALGWLLAFLLVGLLEEFTTRGYLQYTVARGVAGLARALAPDQRHSHAIGFWVAASLFSVCFFMAGHLGNTGETASGILAVGLAGAVFAFSLYRTGTLWWAIGFHTAWDWAQSFLYGVADSGLLAENRLLAAHPTGSALLSGGTTGPEGSLLVIPTLLLVAGVIYIALPRRAYPLTHDQTELPAAASDPMADQR